jgi:7,8-dihydroneopterin aldolase/epimerase/oxygenase
MDGDTVTDLIRISNVRADCVVGIYDFERVKTQPLIVSVEMYVDVRNALKIEDTVDYAKVRDVIVKTLVDGKFQLIETAAEHIARAVLVPPVQRVKVCVEKPEAIAPALAAVVIERP